MMPFGDAIEWPRLCLASVVGRLVFSDKISWLHNSGVGHESFNRPGESWHQIPSWSRDLRVCNHAASAVYLRGRADLRLNMLGHLSDIICETCYRLDQKGRWE